MARGYLRWSAKELGNRAGVAESTIKRMEQDEGFPVARGANIEAVYKALTDAGIVFLSENGGGVGVRLRSKSAGATESTGELMRLRRGRKPVAAPPAPSAPTKTAARRNAASTADGPVATPAAPAHASKTPAAAKTAPRKKARPRRS
jgi:hypothetical protein